jgi:hypothetical protein
MGSQGLCPRAAATVASAPCGQSPSGAARLVPSAFWSRARAVSDPTRGSAAHASAPPEESTDGNRTKTFARDCLRQTPARGLIEVWLRGRHHQANLLSQDPTHPAVSVGRLYPPPPSLRRIPLAPLVSQLPKVTRQPQFGQNAPLGPRRCLGCDAAPGACLVDSFKQYA